MPLVYTASCGGGCPLAVCAAILNPGMVGEGNEGSAPFSGWAPPVPIARPEKFSVKLKLQLFI